MGHAPTLVNLASVQGSALALADERHGFLIDADAVHTNAAAAGLRAVTAVAELAEREAVERSVAAQFPLIAALLADQAPARDGYERPTAADIQGTHDRAPWCTDSHEDGEAFLSDVCCYRYYDGAAPVPMFWPGKDAGTEQTSLLSPLMDVRPFSDTEARRGPVVNVAVVEDHVVEDMGPDELEAFIATVRAQCDVLDQVHADLVQARAEWNLGGAR